MGKKEPKPKPVITEVTNDVDSAFYLDGRKILSCDPDDLEPLLAALGYEYNYMERWSIRSHEFPESLDDLLISSPKAPTNSNRELAGRKTSERSERVRPAL